MAPLVAGSAWCMRHPLVVLGVSAVLLAVGIFATLKGEVDPSPESYLVGTSAWAAYQKVDRDYGISETAVIAFRELGGTVFDVETVGAVAALDHALADLPGVERVLSIASATALERADGVLDLSPLLSSGPVTKESAIQLATRIRRHPVYGQALVDRQHETTFVFVQLQADLSPLERIAAVRDIRARADGFRARHRSVHLAGTVLTEEAIAANIQRDLLLFVPVAVLLLALLLWLLFAEWIASLLSLAVVGFSSIIVLGAFALQQIPLNLSTTTIPILILAVGLSESVRFLSELRRQHARTKDRDTALVATVEAMAFPSFVALGTAAVGSLALARSGIAPLRQLGYGTALGFAAVYVSLMFVAPIFLRAFKFPRSTRPFASAQWMGVKLGRLAARAERRIVVILAALGLCTGAALGAVSALRVDSVFVRDLDEEHRLRQDLAVIERTLGGADTIELVLDTQRPGYFLDIPALELLERLSVALTGKDGVETAFSLADYLKVANAAMVGSSGDRLRLPASREAVAQLMVVDPTPFSAFVSADQSQARVALQLKARSSTATLELGGLVRAKAVALIGDQPVAVSVTGLPIVYAMLGSIVVDDALRSFAIAAVVGFVLLVLALRSVGMGLVTSLANGLSALFTLATLPLLGIPLDANTLFVLGLVTGYTVHHSFHLAWRYRRARQEGAPTRASALTYALQYGGHPALVSTVLLLVGFSVLALSSFGPTRKTGVFGALLVSWTAVFELLLLPVLLLTADAVRRRYAQALAGSDRFREVSSLLTSLPPTHTENLSASRPERSGRSTRPGPGEPEE